MPSGRRLGVLLAVLLAAIGLAVWHSFSPGGLLWRPPRPPPRPVYDESSHLLPPPQRPPATPAPRPAAPERGRCSVERLLTLSERYAPHQLEGNVGEVYVDRCDGSGPARIVMSGSSGWGNLHGFDDVGNGMRTLWVERAPNETEGRTAIGLTFDPDLPERSYEGPVQILVQHRWKWRGCAEPMYARYQIVAFPRPGGADHLHVEFMALCQSSGEILTGYVRVSGRPEVDLTAPAAPAAAADGQAATKETAEAGDAGANSGAGYVPDSADDDPIDALRTCGAAIELEEDRRYAHATGPLEWMGGYVRLSPENALFFEGRGAAPSALPLTALARAHLKSFDPSAPLTPAMRRNATEIRRQIYATEGDPEPFRLTFQIPAKEVPGHFYLLGPRGPVELQGVSMVGALDFALDRNGCEVGPRSISAAPLADGKGEGFLVWSAEPVAWETQRLAPGKGLAIRTLRAAEGEAAAGAYQLTLALEGRRLRGDADAARFLAAYLVRAGDLRLLWVDYGAGDCVGIRLYEVGDGEELRQVNGLVRGDCM